MDRASIIGIFVGIGAITVGNFFEGGKINSILQPTAAIIVFGGTIGATLLSYPFKDFKKAILSLKDVFFDKEIEYESVVKDISKFSLLVRRKGLIALESEIPGIKNNFLKRAISLSVDTMNQKTLRDMLEQENITYEAEKKKIAKVFETAGGFAPTIGILGAVLGLIHVMENLSDPSKLGEGIAVAFVATIYGIRSANLILLPISKKLINRLNAELYFREMVIEGVAGILTGLNPLYLEEKLTGFIGEHISNRTN